MLQLFYAPGSCSLSPRIALNEAGLSYTPRRVDFARGRKLDDNTDFISINPKNYVPALLLDNGELLTENAVMIQYIADLKPEAKLIAPQGTFERVRAQEWLNFIATELHKGFSAFFSPIASAEFKEAMKERLITRFKILADGLGDKPYLLGEQFSVADGYAFYTMRTWKYVTGAELPHGLSAYFDRIAARPAVQAALEGESALATLPLLNGLQLRAWRCSPLLFVCHEQPAPLDVFTIREQNPF